MNSAVETLFSVSFAWLIALAITSLVSGLLYPVFRRTTQISSPNTRASATLAYSLLPLCIAILTSVLLYFPSLSAMVLAEHCHGMQCAPHAPATGMDAAAASLILAAIIGLMSWLLWSPFRKLWRYLRRSQLVLQLTKPSLQGEFRVIESNASLAWCNGLFRPKVYISKGLIQRLNEEELALVAAHERSHAIRYDNLAQLCIDWVTLLWPAQQRAAACQDFRISAEESCDRAAAPDKETAHQIATLLSKLGSLSSNETDDHLQQRLQSLQTISENSGGLSEVSPWVIIAVLWLGGAYLSAHGVHIMLERIFG